MRMEKELLFCGSNRKETLKKLIGIYDDIAIEADGIKRAVIPNEPMRRVVLIHAERGLGKTRLAMELYKHLSSTVDVNDYWPSNYEQYSERVAVMPRAESCSYKTIPPYLWWGVQVADNPNPGNTIFSSLDDLFPHLVSMRMAHRDVEGNLDIIKELADTAIELGLGVAEDQFGLSAIKRIGEAVSSIGKIVSKKRSESGSALEEGNERAKSVNDEVLSDLDRLLNPRSKYFAHRPAVILVDDAQYADKDPALAAFLEQLISKSAQNNWPILIVLTHWSRQLNETENGQGEIIPPSLVSQVLDHARHSEDHDLGKFAQQRGGSLSKNNYIEFDLSNAVDDLTPAILDLFPNIDRMTVAEIVEMTGGNPRKLEQIIETMRDETHWFEGNDFQKNLTNEGKIEVLAISRLPIEKIVYKRLMDTPKEIRGSMGLASTFGTSFIVDLVVKLAKAQVELEARPNLELSENKYKFLKEIVDKSQNDIGRFSEPLFYDAASKYRKNAGADFASWPSDEVLFEALDELLGKLINEPDAFNHLTDDDLAHSFSVTAERMIEMEDTRAGLALARLVSVENKRGNPEGAYAAANQFIEGFKP